MRRFVLASVLAGLAVVGYQTLPESQPQTPPVDAFAQRAADGVRENAPLAAIIREHGFTCPIAVGLVIEKRDARGRKTQSVYCWTDKKAFDPRYTVNPFTSTTKMVITYGNKVTVSRASGGR
jgi:hypothetical protein